MLLLENSILYFLLLVLRIALSFYLDVGYKKDRFSKILFKKGLKFVLSKNDGTIAFKLSFVLFLVEINPVAKK